MTVQVKKVGVSRCITLKSSLNHIWHEGRCIVSKYYRKRIRAELVDNKSLKLARSKVHNL